MQLKASFLKEINFFTRSHKLLAIVLVLLGLSILDPAIIKALSTMSETLNNTFSETQEENPTEPNVNEIFAATIGNTSEAASGVVAFVGDAATTGLLVTILLLMGVAGKEQKRRATIIPTCSGLRTNNYLFPKFIVYPLAVFLAAIASTFICYFVSSSIFITNVLTVDGIFISGIFLGLFLAFITCTHMFIGLSTSRPGLSATIVIVSAFLLPAILEHESLDLADKYNPIALKYFAAYALTATINGGENVAYNYSNVFASILISIILIVIMYFLTLFILTAKKVDNSGNDTLL